MRRYLLDTGIAADYMDRRHGVFEKTKARLGAGDVAGICVPVLGELVHGIENSDHPDTRFAPLHRLPGRLRLWPFDEQAAFRYGSLQAVLRARGRPMQVPDVQIASVTLSLGNCTVVSKDSDFAAVPGLTVENWAA